VALFRLGLISLLFTLGGKDLVPADDAAYGPFAPNHRPKPFQIRACAEWSRADDREPDHATQWTLGLSDDDKHTKLHLRLTQATNHELTLELIGEKGTMIAGPQVVSDGVAPVAYSGDLNTDGKPDFVVKTSRSGCGLAGLNTTLVFVISNGDTYVISSIFTMYRDDHDLADVDGDGHCDLIHVAVAWSDEGDERDHKYHCYWVYHKLILNDGQWVLAKNDKMFPKWVWYTFKANHKATRRLSAEAKERIWRERGGDCQFFWKQSEVPESDAKPSEAKGASNPDHPTQEK